MTTLEFRYPEGSHLDLQSGWNEPEKRVLFPSRHTFRQFARHDVDGDQRDLTGMIRVDRTVDLERIPPGSERYLVEQGNTIKVQVKGYYWIYFHDRSLEDELTVHYVDVQASDVYDLLEGKAVTIVSDPGRGDPKYKFLLGTVYPPKPADRS